MLFGLFKKNKSAAADFSFLGTDMHSHMIPGVDDGSDSVETSLELLRGFVDLGYKKIITTPHTRPDYFPNSQAELKAGLERLKPTLAAANLSIEVEMASEYFVDYEFLQQQDINNLLTFSGKHLLIELSTYQAPPNLFDTIFQLKIKGYQLILAHPERYGYYASDFEQFEKLKDFGCQFQVNLLSLTGSYGKPTRDLAMKFFKQKMVDFLGTDMHHAKHLEGLKAMQHDGKLMRLVRDYELRNASL
ncbi:MAG: histidinol phosphatase [Saprospiraceae bacterium]|nr:histidinol phosphatase [Saprospiraceae bacterium]